MSADDAPPPLPEEGTLEIREPEPRPTPPPGAVRSFFFRSAEDISAEELLPTERPEGWHLERLRAALSRSAQRVEEEGEVVWRVPWGILVECLGQVLEEMDRDADEVQAVLADALRRAETAVETPLRPAGEAPEAGAQAAPQVAALQAQLAEAEERARAAAARAEQAEARAAAQETALAQRAQEVRYLESDQRQLREQLASAGEAQRAQVEARAREQTEAAARLAALEASLAAEQARATGLETRLAAQAEELTRQEERAREEEERLQRELARLDGFLRAVAEELPPEGQGLLAEDAPTRLANLRALVVELEACARERRAGAALLPLPDLDGLTGGRTNEPGDELRGELTAARERFLPLLERARRGEGRLQELFELVALAQRWCERERSAASRPAGGAGPSADPLG